ncbi:hypothetical protein BV20DRAFT_515966 [Pilatotrama ljubarskyi]|nr:hypothetical protein BV20DRAFT_515966 [Pilatotrama ljubarskyi]
MGIQIALPDNRERNAGAPDLPGGPTVEIPRNESSSQSQKTAPDAREERIKQILKLNSVWPAVQFQCGVTQLCVPLTFEVVSAEGIIEATRDQVRALSTREPKRLTLEVIGAPYSSMGIEYTQVARPNSGARPSEPRQDL